MRIPLFQPVISEEAIEAASEVLRSGWLGLGSKTEKFEKAFADYVKAPYCVGLNSGTAALHLALHLLNLPPGSEVITTPLTFISTNHVILYENCKPVFADIQPHTGNLDINSVAERITDQTQAIILVHYGGYPCDLDEFYQLAHERGIFIIEDCAHACGAIYKETPIGGHGNLHTFSFQATKNLPMGDGGALTTRSEEFDSRLRRLRLLGIDRGAFQRKEMEVDNWEYDVVEVGFNYALNDVHAAIGLAQLVRLDQENALRASIDGWYRNRLSAISGIETLQYEQDRTSSYHLFCILTDEQEALVAKLRSAGVETNIYYRPNHQYRMYQEQDLPKAEAFWQRVVVLPMHTRLTEEMVDHITEVIKKG